MGQHLLAYEPFNQSQNGRRVGQAMKGLQPLYVIVNLDVLGLPLNASAGWFSHTFSQGNAGIKPATIRYYLQYLRAQFPDLARLYQPPEEQITVLADPPAKFLGITQSIIGDGELSQLRYQLDRLLNSPNPSNGG
jgi:hypothetical protein